MARTARFGRTAHRSRINIGGYLLAAAGAILLLGFLAPFLGLVLDAWWLSLLFQVLMAAGLGALAGTSLGAARAAFAVAAIGWLIRVVAIFVPLGPLVDLGNLLAVFGGIAAALLLVPGRGGRAGTAALVVAMLLVAAYVFPMLVAFLPAAALAAIAPLLGASLLVAGLLLPRR